MACPQLSGLDSGTRTVKKGPKKGSMPVSPTKKNKKKPNLLSTEAQTLFQDVPLIRLCYSD